MEMEVHQGLFYYQIVANIKISTWMSNYMSYACMLVIIYPCRILSWSLLVCMYGRDNQYDINTISNTGNVLTIIECTR